MFTIGAMLLMGGWGLTGYVDAYQHAAGAAAGVRWREGEQETTATLRRSTPLRTHVPDGSDGSIAGGDQTHEARTRITSRSPAPQEISLTRQVLPPSSWLYALGVVVMMAGAGLMALMVPWRGARMAAVAEAVPHQHYESPPPPRAPKAPKAPKASKAPKAPKASKAPVMAAPSFPGMPPLQEAQSVAAAPLQATAHESPGKAGVKPLLYKKGA
ncbi:MAG: hypothetical protein IIC52_06070 [Proteobacteria bacterium]|nr:hypothetical protein [Pseudomonadota bacterium]